MKIETMVRKPHIAFWYQIMFTVKYILMPLLLISLISPNVHFADWMHPFLYCFVMVNIMAILQVAMFTIFQVQKKVPMQDVFSFFVI